MAYMPYPLQPPNFLVSTTPTRYHPQPAISQTMYGGRSPTEEPDNVFLHEPWEMPPNAAPNHCAPGCSILINSEEEGANGRRFSLLGKRRNSRSSSFSSGNKGLRRSVSEGLSGGKLANLFDSNPFSFDSAPKTAADIKEETPLEQDGRNTPSDDQPRKCSLRFGELPHRPPELRRASSVSIGVLSRKSMLTEQNGGGTPPRQLPNTRPIIHSTEPEPVDVGEVVKSGARHLWQNLRSSFSGISESTPEPPVNTRASFSAYINASRRASASSSSPTHSPKMHPVHHPSPLHPIPHPSPLHTATPISAPPSAMPDEFANYSMDSAGLPAVKEEPGSGAATPALGKQGSSLGLDKLRLGLEGEDHIQGTGPKERIKSPLASASADDMVESGSPLKHPDPTRRAPSPPPRPEDREGFAAGRVDDEDGDEDTDTTSPEVVPETPTGRRRSASLSGNGNGSAGRNVDVERATREARGETKESAILGFQR